MPRIVDYLRMLRDVEGIHGSFVIATSGSLVDSDLPAIFDDELLGEVAARVARLYETFFNGGGDLETCMLRYAEHKLYVRKMTWGILGILSAVGVNLPALRMVANLVMRRIDPEIATISSSALSAKTLPSPAPRVRAASDRGASALVPTIDSPDPPPVTPEDGRDSTAPSTERHARMYRGRPVEE